MKIGFDNEKYLKIQSEHIRERIAQFDGKLYLELGGKLFDDHHASRVLPGFKPDSKLRMFAQLRDELEIVIVSLGPPWVEYLLFFVISFTNVFLQNLKYIFLIKSTKLKAALIGMVTSIFYATVVVLIAKHGWISVLIVAGTHFLGIYTAKLVCEILERKGYLKTNN